MRGCEDVSARMIGSHDRRDARMKEKGRRRRTDGTILLGHKDSDKTRVFSVSEKLANAWHKKKTAPLPRFCKQPLYKFFEALRNVYFITYTRFY